MSANMASIIPPVTKLSSRIIRILGCNPGRMTLQGTNTYVIGTGKRRILIDAGDSDVPQYIQNLKTVVSDENIDLEHIIVTHWHHDHIGGVKDVVKNVSNCNVWKLPRSEQDNSDEPLPDNIQVKYLKPGDEFKTEGATLRIVHTPGHTTDHIILWLEEEKAIFSGDCILGEGTAVFEDLHDYMASLQNILKLNPNILYPGHGPVVSDPMPKIEYYIHHRNNREKQILDVLQREPNRKFTEMDIVKIIYTDTPEDLHLAAAVNVGHHLQKLFKDKKVISTGTKWQWITNPSSSL
ncbi:Beta-lactamase-like protein 2 homolog [Gryllus bimaculatus]|nr:Beta-lactamase-like protein 2 homolog [Gryllus bimaculatus]